MLLPSYQVYFEQCSVTIVHSMTPSKALPMPFEADLATFADHSTLSSLFLHVDDAAAIVS